MSKNKKVDKVTLSGKCRGRDNAVEWLDSFTPEKELSIDCGELKQLGKAFADEMVKTLLEKGVVKELIVVNAPAHAVLYLQEACYKHGVKKRLKIVKK